MLEFELGVKVKLAFTLAAGLCAGEALAVQSLGPVTDVIGVVRIPKGSPIVLGGYWVIDVRSREEAIEWARRCPAGENDTIEIRRVQEMSEFPEDVQKAAAGFEALRG